MDLQSGAWSFVLLDCSTTPLDFSTLLRQRACQQCKGSTISYGNFRLASERAKRSWSVPAWIASRGLLFELLDNKSVSRLAGLNAKRWRIFKSARSAYLVDRYRSKYALASQALTFSPTWLTFATNSSMSFLLGRSGTLDRALRC